MGIFKRVKDVFLAETNGLIDKCEKPLNMVNQYMREFGVELEKGQRALAHQLFIEKRQALLIADAESAVDKRDRQARLAVAQGEDQIAKLALQEKLLQEKKLAVYREQYATIQEQTKVLEERIAQLLVQSEEYNHRRLLLESRVNVASSLKELNQSVVSFQTGSIVKGFARAEEKVLMIEAELEAINHFNAPAKRSAPQYLDPMLTPEIEASLETLKQQHHQHQQAAE
ncbi:phage shock protein A (PspA) family protein [Paenibacillus taihuensis]|uniref:Phage shock protein A (PspA) family protein n=1 Tax=Paenibacillus taihuensis TaxID=1156355 RepID=A0A3D9Q0E6_9BACL|nr:PspA/IM30 family protein [Paenibacillus taihuensis]REE56305.1 phage shock protein A (PspA) family protein [Paenibacillus taihuensis]